MTPIIVTCIGDIYGGSAEATAQGLRFSTSELSQTAFPLLAGVLVTVAWQYPLLLYMVAIPVAGLVYVWFDGSAAVGDSVADAGVNQSARVQDVLNLSIRPRVMSIIVARNLPPFLYLGFLTFNSFIVVRLIGAALVEAGVLVATCTLIYAVTASQVGRITALLDSRRHSLLLAHLSLGTGLGIIALAGTFSVALVGAGGIGIGLSITLSMYRSIITGMAATELRGGLVSLSESMGCLSATIAPLGIGMVVNLLSLVVGFGWAVRLTLLGFGAIGVLVAVVCIAIAVRSAEICSPGSGASAD